MIGDFPLKKNWFNVEWIRVLEGNKQRIHTG